MTTQPYNILFLCTGNSARSILAEGLVNHLSHGRFKGYSAGSQPMGRVNPLALETLQRLGCDTSGMSSKSWDVYAAPDAPKMDFVITVCDSAAGETCPYWPGMPMTAHWGFPDPSHVEGDDEAKRQAFAKTAQAITQRLRLLLALPMEKLDRLSLQDQLRALAAQ
ncbi:arsenate reductase ArsC [Thermomonas carbonis]|uniref:Arsenate reductase ArsC n=1 Tax=Thermomonas carbonis TaxID=1463158 RepID=A0A7G9SMA0_9GAMM|nr:arsenate reductase ArsC [Thermomonas carbonis]QNN68975.1 arsenate reductase ArsC [Thermomonas carbonis]GHC07551.1 protein-tyrosine-phosphatase [Thermomonas carbonis]